METSNIAKNLINQRKLKGYTQEELSDKATVTVRTIQRIESEEVQPHLNTIKLLATALDIQVKDLMPVENPKEESIQKKWLLLIHGAPLLATILPLANVIIPIFLWIHKRDDNKIYDEHGRKVINFQITMTLLFIISIISLFFPLGYGIFTNVFVYLGVLAFSVIMVIVNIFRVLNDKDCYYPLSFPFLKRRNSAGKILMLALLIVLSGCADKTTRITRLDGTTIEKDSLTVHINNLMEKANVPGLAICIFSNNQLVYEKTFGVKNVKTGDSIGIHSNMYGASLSKAVFGSLIAQLVADGTLDLDKPLEEYLDKPIYEYDNFKAWHEDFRDLKDDSLYQKITARMCMNHTAGFHNWRWFQPENKLKILFEPGTKYSYSGEGMCYLQVILERSLNKSLEEMMTEKVFKPLQMNHSSYRWQERFENDYVDGHDPENKIYPKDKDNDPRAPSTLETTLDDYTKFIDGILNNKLMSAQTRDTLLFRPTVRIRTKQQFGPESFEEVNDNDDIELSYGLGWGILKSPYGIGAFKEGHGSGFQHYSIVFPDTGTAMVILSNSDNAEGIFKDLLETGIADVYTPWYWENYIPYDQRP